MLLFIRTKSCNYMVLLLFSRNTLQTIFRGVLVISSIALRFAKAV